jgi:hypothetical protein
MLGILGIGQTEKKNYGLYTLPGSFLKILLRQAPNCDEKLKKFLKYVTK